MDIELEISKYVEYNPNVFRDKTILLPCDDPEWSNFTKYFVNRFTQFGIKKLISTSYAIGSSHEGGFYKPTLFETSSDKYDSEKSMLFGKVFTLSEDITGDGIINVDDLEWEYLEGNGDYRSKEITELRDEADIIITNPPFSKFRDFLNWILEASKDFIIIGNLNAISYKEVFPHIKNNKIWLGAGKNDGRNVWYQVPDEFETFHKIEDGKKYAFVAGTVWFTNIDHGKRHIPLKLMPQKDIEKFVLSEPFAKYSNYDAIEVSNVKSIPSDYPGLMGVPLSFLTKYCPDQFEIIDISPHFFTFQEMGIKKPPQLKLTDRKDPFARILIKRK
jgi:hypothetical protein